MTNIGVMVKRGFIITDGAGSYLTRTGNWQMKPENEAFVFSADETEEMLDKAQSTDVVPVFISPAIYSPTDDATSVEGPVQPAYPD